MDRGAAAQGLEWALHHAPWQTFDRLLDRLPGGEYAGKIVFRGLLTNGGDNDALEARGTLALLAAAGSVACLAGLLASLPSLPGKGGWRAVGAAGLHVGLAVLVLGMAFSGPYKQEYDLLFQNGKGAQQAGAYRVELLEAQQGRAVDHDYLEARLKIYEGDTLLGELKPQRRMYDKFGTMQFSEVDVVPGLGNELYASFLGLDENASVLIRFSVEPLVNWMWIGGTLMCLFPFLMLARGRKKQTPEAGSDAPADNGPQA